MGVDSLLDPSRDLLELDCIELFEDALARGDRERPFLRFEELVWSYGLTQDIIWGLAAQLDQVGVGLGDRVLTITSNEPRTVALHLSLAMVGASYAPMIPTSTPDEMEFIFGNTGAAAIVVDRQRAERVRSIAHRFGVPMFVLVDPEEDAGQAEEARLLVAKPGVNPQIPHRTNPTSEFAIMYTSGSTGKPKGVVLTHSAAVAAGHLWAERLEFESHDVVLGINPQFHVGGMKNVSVAMACGGSYMMQQQFSRTRFWADVRRAGATGGVLMPAMLAILLTEPERPEDHDNTLRTVVSHLVMPEFERRFGVDIVTVWAMSEFAGAVTLTEPRYRDKRPSLAGWPLHQRIEVDIRDDDGRPVPAGVSGEIWARSPWQFTEYLHDPDATASTIVDGWIRSGDLGSVDEQGRLYYEGRKKNMIKRAGENISGLEVELCLAQHADVVEAAVFGVPDAIRTEEVKAVVTLMPGTMVSFGDLVAWCEQRLAPFKIPRYFELRDEMPRTGVTKIDLPRLRREHNVDRPGWDRTVELD